ncbi:hypothetical protein L1887_06491 [Cichorium endivia]|nr:hypothetical protein L1887_06491 [Cichorium endivia]
MFGFLPRCRSPATPTTPSPSLTFSISIGTQLQGTVFVWFRFLPRCVSSKTRFQSLVISDMIDNEDFYIISQFIVVSNGIRSDNEVDANDVLAEDVIGEDDDEESFDNF